MTPTEDERRREIAAATDAFFAGQAAPAAPDAAVPEEGLPAAGATAPDPLDVMTPASPLQDHLLELEQEFQEQEDEGKV